MHFDAVLTGRKHGQSLETLGHGFLLFNRETKLTKTAQKLSQNSQSNQRNGRTVAPEYATVVSKMSIFWPVVTQRSLKLFSTKYNVHVVGLITVILHYGQLIRHNRVAQWLSGRASDLRSNGRGFEARP